MSQRPDRPIWVSQEITKGSSMHQNRMKQRVNVLQLVNNTAQTQIHYTTLGDLKEGYGQRF